MSKLVLGLIWAVGAFCWLLAVVFQVKMGNNGMALLDSGFCALFALTAYDALRRVG